MAETLAIANGNGISITDLDYPSPLAIPHFHYQFPDVSAIARLPIARLPMQVSVFQLDNRRAVAAFVVRRGRHARDQRMLAAPRPQGIAQTAGAVAVHNAQPLLISQERVIQKLLRAPQRIVYRRADEHELRRGPAGDVHAAGPRDAARWSGFPSPSVLRPSTFL